MFCISVDEFNIVRDVFNTEEYVDEGVTLHEISEDEKNLIANANLPHNHWKIVGGQLVQRTEEEMNPPTDAETV